MTIYQFLLLNFEDTFRTNPYMYNEHKLLWRICIFMWYISCCIDPCASFPAVPPDCLLDRSLGSHEYVTANGIKFHYVTAGDRSKPLMLFLHGFPEVWNITLLLHPRNYGKISRKYSGKIPIFLPSYAVFVCSLENITKLLQYMYIMCILLPHPCSSGFRGVTSFPSLVKTIMW